MRVCSVSVDLDEVDCYQRIHGMAAGAKQQAVYDIALTRIRDFASSLDLPLTLFVIARDLDRNENLVGLSKMVSNGHEIGNHSLDHLYDLTRREVHVQTAQVENANMRIKDALGVRPVGFRAPGYTVSDELLRGQDRFGNATLQLHVCCCVADASRARVHRGLPRGSGARFWVKDSVRASCVAV